MTVVPAGTVPFGVSLELNAVHVPADSRRTILADVSLAIAAGDAVLVQGENGAGKSTLLATLALALPPEKGHICHQDVNQHRQSESARAHFVSTNIRYVAQQPAFFDSLTVAQNVRMTEGVPDHETSAFLASIELMGAQLCGSLSGGERARLALALATVDNARLVILDEPSAALSDTWCTWLHKQLASLHARGATLVLATHDPRLVSENNLFTHTITLVGGRVTMARAMNGGLSPQKPT